MTESALARKMKRKPGARAAIIHAPPGYQTAYFAGSPPAASSLSGTFDWIQVFVKKEAELKTMAPTAARALKPDGLLWISFPKGSSGIQADLTRDKGWDSLKKLELKWVTLISVNETWSAFALRPHKPGESRTRAWN
jgi:hypothetical protein